MGDQTPVTPLIEHLEITWDSIMDLCSDLTEEQWKTPTGCPGWSVQDNISHLVDYESGALGRPRLEAELPADRAHLKNAMGEVNEIGVEARRSRPGAEVLAELREVVAERTQQLRAMTAEELAVETPTPAGMGTVEDVLRLRVMDTWSHEQDIRRALGRPGHTAGPAVDESVAYWSRMLPYVIGKRAGAPDGTTVAVAIDDRHAAFAVIDGRAQTVDQIDGDPTVRLAMPATTFAAHVGGRSDAPTDITITGDDDLGERIVAGLGFLP